MSVQIGRVCEHGYQVAILDGAVRHIATHGVCLPNDQMWRALRDGAAEPDRVTLRDIKIRGATCDDVASCRFDPGCSGYSWCLSGSAGRHA